MSWMDSLQQGIDYIENHLLDEELTADVIAKQVGVSSFHFQRTFSVLTEVSIGEYIRRRRLTLAAEELSQSNEKVIEIAYKYGYDTPESFTKAFRRQHGITPREASANKGMLRSYNRLVIQVTLKGVEAMRYKIVERESFQIIGIQKEFSLQNEENQIGIPKMWDEVNSNGTDEKLFTLNNGDIQGALGVCVHDQKDIDIMTYWIATEYQGEVPKEFDSYTIPASKWAVFEIIGPMPHAMQDGWKRIFSEWFPSNSYKHAGTPELEVYTDEDPFSPTLRSEIWIPIR